MAERPERFLILGASSFYGSNFAKCVEAHGDVVTRVSRPEFDIDVNGGYIDAIMDDENPHYVVNFIASSLVVESWDAPHEWMKTNGVSTVNMIENLRKWEFQKFIHVSTPEVYGSTPYWVTEYQPFNPTTPYAVSRAAGDM